MNLTPNKTKQKQSAQNSYVEIFSPESDSLAVFQEQKCDGDQLKEHVSKRTICPACSKQGSGSLRLLQVSSKTRKERK